MAIVTLNTPTTASNFNNVLLGELTASVATATTYVATYSPLPNLTVAITGIGLSYSPTGVPVAGTMTSISETRLGVTQYTITDIAVPVASVLVPVFDGRLTSIRLEAALTGNDEIRAGAGIDLVYGRAGDDLVLGGGGNDTLFGDEGDDALYGEAGADTLRGGAGDDDLFGGADMDRLEGGDGSDLVDGGDGFDTLAGGTGNDRLLGGAGNDTLNGDLGFDTAAFNALRKQATLSSPTAPTRFVTTAEGTDQILGIEAYEFIDGRLALDVTDRAAVVYRMYGAAFDRAPDPLGFNGWISALERGATAETIALSFTSSAEFGQTYGALDDRGFVEQLYRNVLDREADATGLAGWTGALDAGTLTRGQVLVGFSESREHINKLRAPVEAGLWDVDETAASVARLYYAALDRAPDAGGLTGWTRAVERGVPFAQVSDGFALSAEFQAKYGALSDEGYVRQLYRNVLDREADAAGLAGWVDVLASGRGDRGDVLVGFSESLEFQVKTLPFMDGGILLA